MSNIGEKIKSLRSDIGVTQLQLGEYAGCSGQVISNIERGYTNPSAQVLNKIAEFFHVPSDYLLGKSKSQWIALDPEPMKRTTFRNRRHPTGRTIWNSGRIRHSEYRYIGQDRKGFKYIDGFPDRLRTIFRNHILRRRGGYHTLL